MFHIVLENQEELEVLSDVLEIQRMGSSGKAPAVDAVLDNLWARCQVQLLLLDVGREARASRMVSPCGCECCSGGFCGGCGHAGCGGR